MLFRFLLVACLLLHTHDDDPSGHLAFRKKGHTQFGASAERLFLFLLLLLKTSRREKWNGESLPRFRGKRENEFKVGKTSRGTCQVHYLSPIAS